MPVIRKALLSMGSHRAVTVHTPASACEDLLRLLNISNLLPFHLHTDDRDLREKSWGSVQKGSSSKATADWTGGAYGGVREHGQAARTPLAAFFNTPLKGNFRGLILLPSWPNLPWPVYDFFVLH